MGILGVALHHLLNLGNLLWVIKGLDSHRFQITTAAEITRLVQHVSDATGHASPKVAASLTEHHHAPTRHIFTAVIPNGFNHRSHAAITHAEALSRHTTNIGFATGGPIKRHVADNDILFRYKGRTRRRI